MIRAYLLPGGTAWSRHSGNSARFWLCSALLAAAAISLSLPVSQAQATQIRRFERSFSLPSGSPLELGINQATGTIYSSSFGSTVYSLNGSGTPDPTRPKLTEANGTTPFPFVNSYGLAVDNTAGPNHGDIYVADYSAGNVTQFSPSGIRSSQPPFTAANVAKEGEKQADGLPPVVNNQHLNPTGLAVAANGNLYVADQSNNAVDVFEPNGTFVSQFAAGDISGPNAISLDDSGHLYVAQNGSGLVEFEPSGACVNSCTSLDPSANLGVTTDPEGHVYADEGSAITELNSAGEQIDRFGVGTLATGRGLAFDDASGDIYVADEGAGKVEVFEPLTVPTVTVGSTTNPGQTSITLTGRVDPDSAHGGGEITECSFEYGKTETYGNTAPCKAISNLPYASATEVHANLSGLTSDVVYHYRLVAGDADGDGQGADHTFITHAVVGLETGPATGVTPTEAVLTGSFIGNGEDTHYYFKWGTTESYGETTPEPRGADAGEPSGPDRTPLSTSLDDLLPATTYHFEVVASNSGGTSVGGDQTFTTPPAAPLIAEEAVSGIHSESALIHAKINPGGGATTYHFEYGTDASYGTSVPVTDESVGSGRSLKAVQRELSGLSPDTTYHWRLTATNARGTTLGADRTFTTFPFLTALTEECPNALSRQQTGAALLLDCRAYELVSAPNTGGYNVESDLSSGQTPYADYPEVDGRVLYGVDDGGIPGTNHPTNKGVDPYVATRGSNGWSTEYVGVPANDPFSEGSFSSVPTGADASLETFSFGGPGGCSPCFAGGYTGAPVHEPNGELVQGMVGPEDPGPSAKSDGYIVAPLSSDGDHFIFGTTSRFAPGGNDETGDISIYDRDLKTGETHVISNTEAGAPIPCMQGIGHCTSADNDANGISELAISSDGSHILLGQKVGESEAHQPYYHLYMVINDSAQSIDLTPEVVATPGGPGFAHGVAFAGMTADGSKVFFTTVDPFHTDVNQDTDTSADLYMWSEKGKEEGEPLIRLSRGSAGTGNTDSCDPASNTVYAHWNTTGGEQNCGVVAIGGGGGVAQGDGTVYFLSPERLDGSSSGVQNAPNLYVVRPGSAPGFVATLESSLTGPPLQTRQLLSRSFGSFANPEAVAVDPVSGAVYVADASTGAVYRFDAAGNAETSWSESGKLTFGQYPPKISGLAVGPSGDLYIEFKEGGVREYAPNGNPIREIGSYGDKGIAVDSAGDVYVYSASSDAILKFNSSGQELGPVVSNLSATGLAVDSSNGDLYVDNEGKTIQRLSFNGSGDVIATKVIGSELSGGTALTVDPATNDVYVDDGSQVLVFGEAGEEAGVPIGTGVLHGSLGIGIDSSGELYATNPGHSNIAVFGPPEANPDPRIDNPAVVDAVTEPETRKTSDFEVGASGEFAAFPSTLSLGGSESGGYSQVYRYDTATERIDCASCDPTDAGATAAASMASSGLSLTEAGQIFFDSGEALALRDTDNREDVYEWEPEGVGTCGAGSPTFSKGTDDCLGLISTGSSPFNSSLLGVSADGTDAYFFTHDTLAPQDENGELIKIYAARVEGGFFVTPEPPPCRASDECHGAGSPPPAPPDFHRNLGEGGNEVTAAKCKKGFVEKHGKCTRKAKVHKQKKHHDKQKKHNQKSPTDHRGGKK